MRGYTRPTNRQNAMRLPHHTPTPMARARASPRDASPTSRARLVVAASVVLAACAAACAAAYGDARAPNGAMTMLDAPWRAFASRVGGAVRRTSSAVERVANAFAWSSRACGANGMYCDDGMCERLRGTTRSLLLGQPTASNALTDAVCDFVETPRDDVRKPLVVSLHGSPGVGKSYFHRILARAAYNVTEACPGAGCPGYKIIFGTDYVVREREVQGRMLRDAITMHLERYPESVVVVEEYDKLGCPARGALKQMLEHGAAGGQGNPFDRNITFARSIFVLEANMGFMDVHDATVTHGGSGSRNRAAALGDALASLQRTLKDALFEKWTTDGCEEREDTLKAVGAIDVFVPFVPLDREAVKSIVHQQLEQRGKRKAERRELRRLEWDDAVLERLVDEVEFEGDFAIEGGKEVAIVLSRCVTRALRLLAEAYVERAGSDGGLVSSALRDRVVRLTPASSPSSPIVAIVVS